MSPALRLAACAVVVATGFSGGAVAGRTVDPFGNVDGGHPAAPPPAEDGHEGHSPSGPGSSGGHHSLEMPAPSGTGLLISEAGYTLDVPTTVLTGWGGEPFRFRILGPDGHAVQEFDVRHERRLHLVLVARDLTVYHHLHPELGPDGTWSVLLPALAPGAYQAFAGFAPTGAPADLTLSVGLMVPGDAVFNALPDTGTSVLVDGYTVTLTGTPVAGAMATVTMTVARDGVPVTDLDPYLGALGHLVAIRAGDLAYTHVHPIDQADAGPAVRFMIDTPSPGDYRLFFDFSHAATVHTAAFTVPVTPLPSSPPPPPPAPPSGSSPSSPAPPSGSSPSSPPAPSDPLAPSPPAPSDPLAPSPLPSSGSSPSALLDALPLAPLPDAARPGPTSAPPAGVPVAPLPRPDHPASGLPTTPWAARG